MPRAARDTPLLLLALVLVLVLAGCAGKRGAVRDDEPTLASLAGRSVPLAADPGIRATEEQTIAAYRQFLAGAPKAEQRPLAMRRLGDLEMELADRRAAEAPAVAAPAAPAAAASGAGSGTGTDYRAAIARYNELLRQYPKDPDNDRVLYQLARAQELGGELEAALRTLDRLVAEHPQTPVRDEAQFRRGELLFTLAAYPKAGEAYATLVAGAPDAPYRERALYMQGWSLFKQGRLEEALRAFFGVLDGRIADRDGGLELPEGLSRAERELVEDTFRVASLSLASLDGAQSIPAYIDSDARRSYEHRVYAQLGALYLRQDRTKDAADTYALFASRQPLHAQAPRLQARVIEIYQANGFAALALDAKKAYVVRYGRDSEFQRANPAGWEQAQPLVRTHLAELATHHHALAQKSRGETDVAEAIRWYRLFLVSFPDDPQAPQSRFLLAELLFENARFADAAREYETTAYDAPRFARSADAGYAALLAHAEQVRRAPADRREATQREGVASALRFVERYAEDPRAAAALTDAADQLFALGDAEPAGRLARRVLALNPPASAAQKRVAWTVLAHGAFERKAWDEAEKGYTEVLALTGERDAGRAALSERLAAAVYQQGEQARGDGRAREAVGHFERVATLAPQSSVRATAQYDAAAALIGLSDWDGAVRVLEDFRQRFPSHPLQAEVTTKLAAAQLARGRSGDAALEFERIASTSSDPAIARDALWQAAELHDKAAGPNGSRAAAARVYERYLREHPQPLANALEARWRLAEIAQRGGDGKRRLALLQELRQAELRGGAERSDRSRTLGALAALALAEPALEAYRKVALVEPLARQLKLKKAKMEEVLQAYAAATTDGVAEAATAATFQTADLYQDFGKALLSSQRPKKLSKAEREQYDVLLEEQAFPFEEKAIELHEINAGRAATGLWDGWVARSYQSLATLRPGRYGKAERGAAPVAADALPALEKAAAEQPSAARWNALGVALRGLGRFAPAREAYERAIALDANFADAVLNLGILHDLYLREPGPALAQYERFLALQATPDAAVSKWVAELRNRRPAAAAAQLGKKE